MNRTAFGKNKLSAVSSMGLPSWHQWWRTRLPIQEMWVQFLGWEYPLEEGVATHSTILAWRIPWTEEPGGLQTQSCKELDTTEVTRDINTHVFCFETVLSRPRKTSRYFWYGLKACLYWAEMQDSISVSSSSHGSREFSNIFQGCKDPVLYPSPPLPQLDGRNVNIREK